MDIFMKILGTIITEKLVAKGIIAALQFIADSTKTKIDDEKIKPIVKLLKEHY